MKKFDLIYFSFIGLIFICIFIRGFENNNILLNIKILLISYIISLIFIRINNKLESFLDIIKYIFKAVIVALLIYFMSITALLVFLFMGILESLIYIFIMSYLIYRLLRFMGILQY